MKNLRVLIVEDDAFSRVALSDALRHQNLSVVGAVESAYEALELQKKFSPQVAVCDLDLGVGPDRRSAGCRSRPAFDPTGPPPG